MSIRQGTISIAGAPKDVTWGGIEGTITDQVDLKNELDKKVNSTSATLTGTPTAPTAATGTANNQIATTQFVSNAIAAAGSGLPSQEGHSGQYLTTNGTTASWSNVDSLPSQSGQSGKYLTTNGTTASWGSIPSKISDLTDTTSTTPIAKANTLTGLTATVTELNYTDGVTSNIQTQLNNKQASGSYLTTNTTQNITATKTSTTSTGLEYKSSSAQSKSTPIAGSIQELNSKDANNSVISTFGTKITSTGSETYITTKAYNDDKSVAKEGTISIVASSSGVVTSAPTPTDDTLDSTQIDTVGARNTKLNTLIPSQSGQSGKYLTTNGTTTSWGEISSTVMTITDYTA